MQYIKQTKDLNLAKWFESNFNSLKNNFKQPWLRLPKTNFNLYYL